MKYMELVKNKDFSALGKSDYLDEELYSAIASEYRSKKETDWILFSNKMIAAASELGADTGRTVKAMLSALKKDMQTTLPAVGNEYDIVDDNPLELDDAQLARAVCLNYAVDSNGIYEMTPSGGKKLFCHTPIAVIRDYNAIEGNGVYYELVYMRTRAGKKEVCNKIYPANILCSKTQITQLAMDGILVGTNNAAALVDYIMECVANGQKAGMPSGQSTKRFGWVGDSFVPYDNDIMFAGGPGYNQIYDAATSVKGDKDEYMDHMRDIRAKRRVEINACIAGAMSSLMVDKYLHSAPFILHVYGPTDSGKTMGMRYALSQVGDPKEGALMSDYRGSKAGMEARIGCLHNLPLALDDISKMSLDVRKNLEHIVYNLTGNQSRQLSNEKSELREVKIWHCVTLSTGEDKLTSYCQQGGGLNRVLEINAGNGLAFDHPEREIRFLEKNHGHVIRDFIKVLRELGEDAINDLYEQVKDDIKARLTDNVLAKQLQPLAILLTADQLLTDYIYKDGVYLKDDIDALCGMLKTEKEVSDGARAYDVLLDLIAANPQKWYMDNPQADEAQGEQWGWKPMETEICITGTALNNVLGREGFNSKQFIAWAIREGITTADKYGNAPVQHLRTYGALSEKKRAWRIKLPDDTFELVEGAKTPWD